MEAVPPAPPPPGDGGSPPPPPAVAACADGRDNDGDGFVDLGDPGCTSASDTDETHTIDGDLDVVGTSEGEVGGVVAGSNFLEKCKFVWGGVVVKHRVFGWTYFRFRLSLTFCYNQAAVTRVTNVNAISTFTRYPWVFRGLVSGPTTGACRRRSRSSRTRRRSTRRASAPTASAASGRTIRGSASP